TFLALSHGRNCPAHGQFQQDRPLRLRLRGHRRRREPARRSGSGARTGGTRAGVHTRGGHARRLPGRAGASPGAGRGSLVRTCAALLLMAAAIGTTAAHAETKPGKVCTIAAPPSRATIEARIPYADEFCELLSRSLAGDVFRAPLIVTPRRAWHYPDASLSCRLSFRGPESLTIRNSIATSRWLARHAAGWQLEDLAD